MPKVPIIKYSFYVSLILALTSCTLFQKRQILSSDCKKDAIKKLKKLNKTLRISGDGVYSYLHNEVDVPDGFETIFWERKIGRDYAVSIQLSDTLAMQYLLLPIALQNILYNDCEESINKEELVATFGPPTYIAKSLLAHAKQSYVYSFNKPDQGHCFHKEYMGNVAYQDCLSITIDVDSKGRVVELNTSSFDIGQ